MAQANLTYEQWAKFDEQGYVRLGKTARNIELAALRERIDAIMLGTAPVDINRFYMQLDSSTGEYDSLDGGGIGTSGATLNYRKIQNLEFDPIFREYMEKPIFESICKHCYGENVPIACFRAMFMNKPARQGTLLPWHQDAWTNLDRQPLVTVWTALDRATIDNGCVEVVPGSHKLGLVNPAHGSGFLGEEHIEKYCVGAKTAFLELEPGESVLLHNWLMHRSDVNRSQIPRRAFSVCYLDARTVTKDGSHFTPMNWHSALTAKAV